MSDGLFRIVGKDDLIGFANMDGKVVIEPRFQYAFTFREGLAPYCDGCIFEPYVEPSGYINEKKSKKLKGKYGFINKKGEVAIYPQFDMIQHFKNGRAKVWIGDREFYIDKKGKEVS